MKTLILVRHAKASAIPETDFDRMLSKRGIEEAVFMANAIAESIADNPIIFSSPAKRALMTAEIFSKRIKYPVKDIIEDRGIYEKGTKYIRQMIASIDDKSDLAIVFGHNPDITSLVSYFVGDFMDSVPTGGVVCIDFDIDSWRQTENKNGKLRFFEVPAKYLHV